MSFTFVKISDGRPSTFADADARIADLQRLFIEGDMTVERLEREIEGVLRHGAAFRIIV